ncbi:type II toxin-antitoxin system VapC family toxin [Candidatus Poribacteria bacterium]|nr:type II toxin-antitoxin system VapC family toxin [Candidatus Poribacteria bacterium]
MYLLDTTHCLQIIFGFPQFDEKRKELEKVLLATCAIVRGELLYGVFKSERLDDNLHKVENFLESMRVYPVDDQTANVYGELKCAILDQFGPKLKNKRRNVKTESLGFKDNDIWIASVAIQHNLTVLSADNHFRRLAGLKDLKVENWSI